MNKTVAATAEKLSQFLEDHRCTNVNILDIAGECSWADCFIIATVNSVGHLKGVAHELWGEINELELSVANRHKSPQGDGWELIDCGDIVIHLMSEELRDFYSLEKLWQSRSGSDADTESEESQEEEDDEDDTDKEETEKE
ncbi:MAG TPA: ribosome silencing factor [Sphaerochaeta sp.]|nr:ribosome silencing factor [Sphaerochaeta sp.]